MSQRVELHNAWIWTCHECGQDNFERSVTAEMSEEDRRFYAEELELDVSEFLKTEFVTQPDTVVCSHCEARFDVEPQQPPEGFDDDYSLEE